MNELITDGKIMYESLNALQIGEEEIHKQLKANNTKAEKVFLMTMDRYNNCNIVNKG